MVSEYLRLSGVYWCLAAMDVMHKLDDMDKERIANFVIKCQQPNGGFAPALEHDPHLLHTLSAIQASLIATFYHVLFMFHRLLHFCSFDRIFGSTFIRWEKIFVSDGKIPLSEKAVSRKSGL